MTYGPSVFEDKLFLPRAIAWQFMAKAVQGSGIANEDLLNRISLFTTAQTINELVNEIEYLEVRVHDELACGDFCEELRDRTVLREAATALQFRVEELEAELTTIRRTYDALAIDYEKLRQELRDTRRGFVLASAEGERQEDAKRCVVCELPITTGLMRGMGDGSDDRFAHEVCYWRDQAESAETMQKCYSEELTAISKVIPPGEHDRYLTHQGALLQRVEDTMARLEYLEKEVKEYMGALQKARGEKQDAESSRDYKTLEIMELQDALAKYPCSDPTTENDDMTEVPCGVCPECKALAAKKKRED